MGCVSSLFLDLLFVCGCEVPFWDSVFVCYFGQWVLGVPMFKRIERGFYVVRNHDCVNSRVFNVKE